MHERIEKINMYIIIFDQEIKKHMLQKWWHHNCLTAFFMHFVFFLSFVMAIFTTLYYNSTFTQLPNTCCFYQWKYCNWDSSAQHPWMYRSSTERGQGSKESIPCESTKNKLKIYNISCRYLVETLKTYSICTWGKVTVIINILDHVLLQNYWFTHNQISL